MYETYKKKVIAFYESHRRMPSYGEIMDLAGFKSKNAAAKLVEKLVNDGIVNKDARGRLTPARHFGVPILGLVEAGFPSPAEEELLDVMDFDDFLTPNKESSYILRVKGDSMIDAGIREGDLVVAERKGTYKAGQIVIASVDNEFTMKYLRQKDGRYFLEPANSKYKPIYPTGAFRVEATVTAVVRKY